MANSATLALRIVGDASSGVRALDDVDDKAGINFGRIAGYAAAGAAAVAVAVGSIAVASFNAASDLEQSQGAVQAIFGDTADRMTTYAQQAAQTVGLSQTSYGNLASVLGAQLQSAGYAGDELSTQVDGLIGLGSDLAAQFGGSTADAVEALSSVLKGETDPIERYGVSIKQSDINARLAAQGQDQLTGEALKNATAQAALALVTEQTASAQGAFARESDTASGAQARLSAWWENAQATLGQKLLPIFLAVVGFITDNVVPAFENFARAGGPLQTMLQQVGDFVQAQLLPAIGQLWDFITANLLPAWQSVAGSMADIVIPAFMGIFNVVTTYVAPIIGTILRPIIDGIVGVWGALAEALERNKGKFQEIYENVQPFLAFLRDNLAPFIAGTLTVAFNGLKAVIGPVIDLLVRVSSLGSSVVGFVTDIFSSGDSGAGGGGNGGGGSFGAARAGRMMGATRGASPLRAASSLGVQSGGGTGPGLAGLGSTVISITVNGALDPDAVADQIMTLIERRQARTGQRVAVMA